MDSTTAPTPAAGPPARAPEAHRRREAAGARGLAAPHRAALHAVPLVRRSVVVAIIVASSVVGLASPFLLRGVIDVALPDQDLRLLVLLAAGMVAVAAVTSVLGVVQTWISTQIGQRVMHGLRTDVFAHLQRQSIGVLHPDPHRRGAVPDHQRHRRHAVRRHLDRDLDRVEPDHHGGHRGRDGRRCPGGSR